LQYIRLNDYCQEVYSAYPCRNSCRSVTLTACSRGDLPLVSSHDCRWDTLSSWLVAGFSTETFNRVAGPTAAKANPQRRNSAMASAAASNSEEAVTETVWVTPAPSVNDTRQEVDTIPA